MTLALAGLAGGIGAGAVGAGGLAAGLGGLAKGGLDAFLKSGSFNFQNDDFSVGFNPQDEERKRIIDELLRTLNQPRQGLQTTVVGGNTQPPSAITPISSFGGSNPLGGPLGLGGLASLLGPGSR